MHHSLMRGGRRGYASRGERGGVTTWPSSVVVVTPESVAGRRSDSRGDSMKNRWVRPVPTGRLLFERWVEFKGRDGVSQDFSKGFFTFCGLIGRKALSENHLWNIISGLTDDFSYAKVFPRFMASISSQEASKPLASMARPPRQPR